MNYKAILKREGKRWLVEFPDCPGCVTFGDSKAEALTNAVEALEGWLEANLVRDLVPPLPKARKGEPILVNMTLAIAILLKVNRRLKHLTQAAVAKKAQLSQQQVARLESATGNPTVDMVTRVARALSIAPELSFVATH